MKILSRSLEVSGKVHCFHFKIKEICRSAFMGYFGQWCSPGTLVSSTNKTDRHDITEILLNVA
jgi:hypothetical protein